MKLAVDVQFDAVGARVAGVAFDEWSAPEATRTYLSQVAQIDKPVKGELDLRKLPCVLQLLREHGLQPELILIDGFVHLDAQDTPGLGHHLYHALAGHSAIVGLSKSAMPGEPAQYEVHREEETRPLYVTCLGIDLGAAKARVRMMHGRKRLPTLVKLVAA